MWYGTPRNIQYVGGYRVHVKKHLSFSGLRKTMSKRFRQTPDCRSGKVDFPLHDFFMSAFAMMFFQDPSLTQFQQRMKIKLNISNLQTVFGVENIPGDSQFRDVLDNSPIEETEAIFADFLHLLQKGKQLEGYRFIEDSYLIPIDGSEYFSSEKICCPQCLTTASKGTVRFHHQILQAVIVHPDNKQVLPFAPEPIRNSDGSEKQDCEINAGKRMIARIRNTHPKLKIIITGDGLYSKQPFVDALKQADMLFILVAKPADHKILFEWVNDHKQLGAAHKLEFTDHKKRTHRYEWVNGIPLNGSKDADEVNFFEYSLINNNKVTFHNTWVTDIKVTDANVVNLVKGGRARWKIENETFNTLKNQGYHIEHNFGHGFKNLSHVFFLLNLLAFYLHQILELSDRIYQTCRAGFTSRKEYWNQLRCTFRVILFNSWEHMLLFIIDPESQPP